MTLPLTTGDPLLRVVIVTIGAVAFHVPEDLGLVAAAAIALAFSLAVRPQHHTWVQR